MFLMSIGQVADYINSIYRNMRTAEQTKIDKSQ